MFARFPFLRKRLREIKIVAVGDAKSGKSALIRFFCERKFIESQPTIGVDYGLREFNSINLHFWDLAGHPLYSKVRADCYENTDVVLIIIDMSTPLGLDSLNKWLAEVPKNKLYLVGNKTDLVQRISREKLSLKASELNIPVFFCSAKNGENIVELFQDIIK